MRTKMSRGFAFIVAFAAVLLLALYMDIAQADVTQGGSWEGQSESYSGVYIDQGAGDTIQKGSDLSRRVPDVSAPSIITAYDCGKGVSGGVALPGVGITGGGVVESVKCNRRLNAAAARGLGDLVTAREQMCADEEYYTANKRSQQIYAHIGKAYVDEHGLPMACYPNPEFEAAIVEERAATYERINDPHNGAIPSSWSDN